MPARAETLRSLAAPCPDFRDAAAPSIGAEMPSITTALEETGVVGMIAVDASGLRGVERYGVAAHREVTARLLARVREHLAPLLREPDRVVLGELGRDEILVLLFRADEHESFHRCELPAIAHALGEELAAAGRNVAYPYLREPLRFAIGRSTVLHDPTLRPEVLIRRGRERALEDAALNAQLETRERRERFLSLLLENTVKTVFEPIVQLATGEVHGYEALVRGTGPLTSPKDLFELAIETDLLFAFDCLCRRSAFQAARRLPDGAKLFLNCLPSAIHDPSLVGDPLRRTLSDHPLQPNDVVLEISERESIENFSIFREACDRYRELGFQIALDDVGVGYASLEVVTELCPDYIKVDRAFVRGIDTDPERREVLVALDAIARRLGANIIAEGIESPAELELLRGLSVAYGQGFLLGRASALDSE